MICRLAYVGYEFINGNIKSIENINIAYVKPHILKVKGNNKILLIGLALTIVAAIIGVIVFFINTKDNNFGNMQNNSSTTENDNQKDTAEFYVIYKSEEFSGTGGVDIDFEGEKVKGYDKLEKYNMGFVDRDLFSLYVPIILDTNHESGRLFTDELSMSSDELYITYKIYAEKTMKYVYNDLKETADGFKKQTIDFYEKEPDELTNITEVVNYKDTYICLHIFFCGYLW